MKKIISIILVAVMAIAAGVMVVTSSAYYITDNALIDQPSEGTGWSADGTEYIIKGWFNVVDNDSKPMSFGYCFNDSWNDQVNGLASIDWMGTQANPLDVKNGTAMDSIRVSGTYVKVQKDAELATALGAPKAFRFELHLKNSDIVPGTTTVQLWTMSEKGAYPFAASALSDANGWLSHTIPAKSVVAPTNGSDSGSGSGSGSGSSSGSGTSNPKTADASVVAIAAVACLALAGVVVAKKVK